MRVLHVAYGADLGGLGARLAAASSSHPETGLSIRAVRRVPSFLDYAIDLDWRRDARTVARLFAEADVVHVAEQAAGYLRLASRTRCRPPAILYFAGSLWRRDPARRLAEARRYGFLPVVGTPEMLRPAPELDWLPSIVDVARLSRIREEFRREPDGVIRVLQAPTRRGIKSTEGLIRVVEELRAEGLPIELDLVERVPNAEALRRKAAADIVFDQVLLGYGVNALEAWAMSLPVVAGADPWTLDRMRAAFDGPLPFYEATEASIRDALVALVESPALRAAYGEKGRDHVERYHDELPVLARAAELYEQARAFRR